jgi:hypothetical protein
MKTTLIMATLVGALSGCGEAILRTTPQWDARFGDATRAAFAQQVMHPNAGRDNRPVNGQDGQSAVAAQQRYQKSFAAPQPAQSVFTIGVSGSQ